MKTKHTPGPWKYSNAISKNCFYIETIDQSHKITLIGVIGGGIRLKYEIEANAKLIAAATELLEASIKLVEWSKKYPPGKIYDYGMANQIEKELTEITQLHVLAIKKATE